MKRHAFFVLCGLAVAAAAVGAEQITLVDRPDASKTNAYYIGNQIGRASCRERV